MCWQVKKLAVKAFRNEGGSFAILGAIIMVPIVIAVGLGIDYFRLSSTKTQLQSSLDAGLLAAAHSLKETNNPNEVKTRVEQQVRKRLTDSGIIPQLASPVSFQIAVQPESISASISSTLDTTFMALAQIKTMNVAVSAATENRTEPVEMVMVLDTTESMGPHMNQLRLAAQELVDIITTRGANRVARVAMVPYVGAVNIGNSRDRELWVDVAGDSPFNGINLRGLPLITLPTCDQTFEFDGVIDSVSGGRDREGTWLEHLPFGAIKTGFNELFGIKPAQAYDYELDPCFLKNPRNIHNWGLFSDLGGAQWKGCVEARPIPFDVNDTPPNRSDPRTLWVPYFWPDGSDRHTLFIEGVNNYIPDDPYYPDTNMNEHGFGRAYNIKKYDGRRAIIAETGPNTIGPNKACPDPLVPLTNNYNLLRSNITSLTHYIGSGTNSAEGIAWGMRVLSPQPPFTEGAPYGSVPKVMVLLSDGRNEILRDDGGQGTMFESGGAFLSHYSSYGTLRFGQFPKLDYDNTHNFFEIGEAFLDNRMDAACTNAKRAGIELYVVALGVVEAATMNGLSRCATSAEHFIRINQGNELPSAFRFIAQKFSPIRLTR